MLRKVKLRRRLTDSLKFFVHATVAAVGYAKHSLTRLPADGYAHLIRKEEHEAPRRDSLAHSWSREWDFMSHHL